MQRLSECLLSLIEKWLQLRNRIPLCQMLSLIERKSSVHITSFSTVIWDWPVKVAFEMYFEKFTASQLVRLSLVIYETYIWKVQYYSRWYYRQPSSCLFPSIRPNCQKCYFNWHFCSLFVGDKFSLKVPFYIIRISSLTGFITVSLSLWSAVAVSD